jgi:hypothetical protein
VANQSYVVRHWRGDLSLATSYWLNMVVIGAVFRFCWVIVARWTDATRGPPIFAIGFFIFMVALYIWQVVGVWRSAGSHVERGGKKFWAVCGRIFGVLTAVIGMGTLVLKQ